MEIYLPSRESPQFQQRDLSRFKSFPPEYSSSKTPSYLSRLRKAASSRCTIERRTAKLFHLAKRPINSSFLMISQSTGKLGMWRFTTWTRERSWKAHPLLSRRITITVLALPLRVRSAPKVPCVSPFHYRRHLIKVFIPPWNAPQRLIGTRT